LIGGQALRIKLDGMLSKHIQLLPEGDSCH
jgi:hypothetical protein